MNGLFIRAIKEDIPLEMIYISGNQQITQRKIMIQEINASTIRAYCFLRKQTRLFKIDNILSIMPAQHNHRKIS